MPFPADGIPSTDLTCKSLTFFSPVFFSNPPPLPARLLWISTAFDSLNNDASIRYPTFPAFSFAQDFLITPIDGAGVCGAFSSSAPRRRRPLVDGRRSASDCRGGPVDRTSPVFPVQRRRRRWRPRRPAPLRRLAAPPPPPTTTTTTTAATATRVRRARGSWRRPGPRRGAVLVERGSSALRQQQQALALRGSAHFPSLVVAHRWRGTACDRLALWLTTNRSASTTTTFCFGPSFFSPGCSFPLISSPSSSLAPPQERRTLDDRCCGRRTSLRSPLSDRLIRPLPIRLDSSVERKRNINARTQRSSLESERHNWNRQCQECRKYWPS